MANEGFWYLATPYAKYYQGVEAAYNLACDNAALFIEARIPVFSPIAHSHGIANAVSIWAKGHNIWLPMDQPFIDAAKGLVMLKAVGWGVSVGMGYELEQFKKAGKPIVWMEPYTLPDYFTQKSENE